MTEHVHGCLKCRPDMVPDFSKDDPRYHDGEKCGPGVIATVDGVPTGYTRGVFEGPDGWILAASRELDVSQVHECPACTMRDVEGFTVGPIHGCVEPLFGNVVVTHECPSKIVARADRLEAALRPLVSEDVLHGIRYGEGLS